MGCNTHAGCVVCMATPTYKPVACVPATNAARRARPIRTHRRYTHNWLFVMLSLQCPRPTSKPDNRSRGNGGVWPNPVRRTHVRRCVTHCARRPTNPPAHGIGPCNTRCCGAVCERRGICGPTHQAHCPRKLPNGVYNGCNPSFTHLACVGRVYVPLADQQPTGLTGPCQAIGYTCGCHPTHRTTRPTHPQPRTQTRDYRR